MFILSIDYFVYPYPTFNSDWLGKLYILGCRFVAPAVLVPWRGFMVAKDGIPVTLPPNYLLVIGANVLIFGFLQAIGALWSRPLKYLVYLAIDLLGCGSMGYFQLNSGMGKIKNWQLDNFVDGFNPSLSVLFLRQWYATDS